MSARSILALALSASTLCACAAPVAAPASDPERTFRGLTLDEWIAIPWSASGSLHDGRGQFSYQRDAVQSLPALRAFAAESPRALARLAQLAADLDDEVREEAAAYLVEVALSHEPNQSAAMEAVMAMVGAADMRVAMAAMGELASALEDEPAVLEQLGQARTSSLVAQLEPVLFGSDDYAFACALEVLDTFAGRSPELDARFLTWLTAAPERFQASEASEELDDFAWECVKPKAHPRHPALALAAARTAAALEPDEPGHQTTLALALWRNGKREEALDASRRAVEANADLESEYTNRILDSDHHLSLDSTWAPR